MAMTLGAEASGPGSFRAFAAGIELDEDGAKLTIHGDLDDEAAPDLRRRLLELLALPLESVTIDLGDVRSVSTSCSAVLAEALTAARDRRIPMMLRGIDGSP
jgi:anti-anti-sigma factor